MKEERKTSKRNLSLGEVPVISARFRSTPWRQIYMHDIILCAERHKMVGADARLYYDENSVWIRAHILQNVMAGEIILPATHTHTYKCAF